MSVKRKLIMGDDMVMRGYVPAADYESLAEALKTLFAACDAPVVHHPVLGPKWLGPAMDIARAALDKAGL